jgi:prophage regulatory protein
MSGDALPAGLTPRYLTRAQAAAYLGVSVDTFNAEVRLGWWPPARPRGLKGILYTWDRKALDAAADLAMGIGGLAPTPQALRDAAEAAASDGVRRATQRDPEDTRPAYRLLRLAEVSAMVGLGRTSIYHMIEEGAFPSARRVGEKAVRWLESEVVEWMQQRPATKS